MGESNGTDATRAGGGNGARVAVGVGVLVLGCVLGAMLAPGGEPSGAVGPPIAVSRPSAVAPDDGLPPAAVIDPEQPGELALPTAGDGVDPVGLVGGALVLGGLVLGATGLRRPEPRDGATGAGPLADAGATRRWLGVTALVLLGAGGYLVGRGLIKPSFRADADGGLLYEEVAAACEVCPVVLTSVSVQQLEGGALFAFGGQWPPTPAGIRGDVRLELTGGPITLRPSQRGFQIVEGPADVAVGLRPDALLVHVPGLRPPDTFAFGTWDDNQYTNRIPRQGLLTWTGQRLAVSEVVVGEPGEDPAAFVEDLAEALRRGDEMFLFERLHPAVFELYGEKVCAEHVGTLKNPELEWEIVSVSGPEPFLYAPDGKSIQVPGSFTVRIEASIEGEAISQDIHLAPGVEDRMSWFTDCGTPRS